MQPLSILVADDVAEIQALVRGWLVQLGHKVTCASSGTEAARMLGKQRFDLLITDVLMPDGDGLGLIGKFKAAEPAARILAISGGSKHLPAGLCIKFAAGFGAHAVLGKPFNRQQLLDAIGMALRSDEEESPLLPHRLRSSPTKSDQRSKS